MQEFTLRAERAPGAGGPGRGRLLRSVGGCSKRTSEWIEAQAPVIISEATFAKAQVQLAENRHKAARMYQPSSRRYLLRTLVHCGACGLGMQAVRQTSGGRYEYLYYACKGNVPLNVGRATRCHARRVRADHLDGVVWTSLRQLLQQPETLEKAYQLSQELSQGDQRQFDAQWARLERQSARLQRQLQRLLDAYQHELIELEDFARRRAQLVTQQAAVDKEGQQLHFQQRQCLRWEQVVEEMETFSHLLRDRLDTLSFAERQQLVQLLLEKIVVFSNGDVEMHHLLPTGGATSGSHNGRSSAMESCPTEESIFFIGCAWKIRMTLPWVMGAGCPALHHCPGSGDQSPPPQCADAPAVG